MSDGRAGHLGAAYLAHDQSVGAHPRCLTDEVAQGDLTGALDIGWTALQGNEHTGRSISPGSSFARFARMAPYLKSNSRVTIDGAQP